MKSKLTGIELAWVRDRYTGQVIPGLLCRSKRRAYFAFTTYHDHGFFSVCPVEYLMEGLIELFNFNPGYDYPRTILQIEADTVNEGLAMSFCFSGMTFSFQEEL